MLNNDNYYSTENAYKFMSASQFKSFQNCEAMALAEVTGEWKRDFSSALAIGSYVDAFVEGTLDNFITSHPEVFTQKGTLRAEFVQADELCKRIASDEMFMKYLNGEHQKIFTGTIAGVNFKGKLDAYHAGKCIVDLKTCKSFEPVWKNGHKMSFIEAWGYDLQLAIYQELVYQNTGQKLPVFICAVTKEKVPDIAVISIPQERLDFCLEVVKTDASRYDAIKHGEIEPSRCCKCDYCKSTKKVTNIIDYRDLNSELFADTKKQAENEVVSVGSIVSLPTPTKCDSVAISDIFSDTKNRKKKNKKKKKRKDNKVVVIKI